MQFVPQKETVCLVCQLLDNDDTIKRCTYCARCDAWICDLDTGRWDRRARAMVKKYGNQFGPNIPVMAPDKQKASVSPNCKQCGK